MYGQKLPWLTRILTIPKYSNQESHRAIPPFMELKPENKVYFFINASQQAVESNGFALYCQTLQLFTNCVKNDRMQLLRA